ncbi:glycosyltransferase [Gordonia sp. NPDC003424]
MAEHRRFAPANTECDVAVLIVTYNSQNDVLDLIGDLRREASTLRVRVVIVDNDSTDGTVEIVCSTADDVVLIKNPAGNAGFAGGINEGIRHAGPATYVLILNPDLRVEADAISELIRAIGDHGIGAAVPRTLDEDRTVNPSLRSEPNILRTLGESIFGSRVASRPKWLREGEYNVAAYDSAHSVDWATGAAILLRSDAASQVGLWDERFFLYSEEVDFCRRLRDCGWAIQYVPSATVVHRRGGSGLSPELDTLLAVNKVRYIEKWHPAFYALVFRAAVLLGASVRVRKRTDLAMVFTLGSRKRWQALPSAVPARRFLNLGSGAVIVPAHNEERTIQDTLAPLSSAAARGAIELIVVANGCTDQTVARAREVPGVIVVDLAEASKPAALNAGNDRASLWPRLYLDADIKITESAVADTFSALGVGDIRAARPSAVVDTKKSDWIVRRFYRCRSRVESLNTGLWGAGAYAVDVAGASVAGPFPQLTADDLWIDLQFDKNEIAVVSTDSVIVTAPRSAKALVHTLKRVYRGKRELSEAKSATGTVRDLLHSIAGPQSALDVLTYGVVVTIARLRSQGAPRSAATWERDDSSRSE